MLTPSPRRAAWTLAALLAGALAVGPALAQDDPYASENMPDFDYPTERDYTGVLLPGPPPWAGVALGDGPWDMESFEQRHLRVSVVTKGFSQPRSMAFLPGGEILITEGAGRLRIVRDGVIDPDPVPGTPEVVSRGTMAGLSDIALHPDFADNGLIYISYHKPVYGNLGANSIWRGTWTGDAIEGGEDIFVSDDVDTEVSRIEFGADGKLYMTIGGPGTGPMESLIRPQHGDDFAGKTLRLNEDGSVPEDNPFVGMEGYNPEVFTMGHRNQLGLAVNPETGELWAAEQGPNGGDEVNILRAGQNYGWPVVSDGRDYRGPYISEVNHREDMERPHIMFVPSPALSGMLFYTGDAFPEWQGNLFVGAMRLGETARTGHLIRFAFNDNWEELRREMLLFDLHQRIRDVAQGPDGLIYVITAENDAALLKLEPVGEPFGE